MLARRSTIFDAVAVLVHVLIPLHLALDQGFDQGARRVAHFFGSGEVARVKQGVHPLPGPVIPANGVFVGLGKNKARNSQADEQDGGEIACMDSLHCKFFLI